MQISQADSPSPLDSYARRADTVVIAWMEHAEVVAEGDKVNSTVRYRVIEVLKGGYDKETLVLTFDSSSFKQEDLAARGSSEEHKLLILFLRGAGEPRYIGPPIDSPSIKATSENLAALRKTLAEPEVTVTQWFEVNKLGAILVAAFVIVLFALFILLRKRPKHSTDTNDLP